MVAIPDPGDSTTMAVTGTKLLLLGILLGVIAVALDADAFVLLGLVVGIAGLFIE